MSILCIIHHQIIFSLKFILFAQKINFYPLNFITFILNFKQKNSAYFYFWIKNNSYFRILKQPYFAFSTLHFYGNRKNTLFFYFLTHKKGRHQLNKVSAFSILLSIPLLSFFSNTDLTG